MTIKTVGIIGAGTMGNGIAQACAVAGIDAVMLDINEAAVQKGIATVSGSLDRLVKKEKMTAEQKAAAMARIKPTTQMTDLKDVDIVIDLQILADTQAYQTLEQNFKKLGFERAINDRQQTLSWRWQTKTEHGAIMVLELLADAPDIAGGRVQALPTERRISALNVPHSSIVFDLNQATEIQAELLGGNGIVTEWIRHANLVSFTCLKAFAFDQRFERKDAHDLIYCIEHAPEGTDVVAKAFRKELEGKHRDVVDAALVILHNRFASDDKVEGYLKDGPVSVAKFELGEGDDAEQREARILRQREVSELIEQLLGRVRIAGST